MVINTHFDTIFMMKLIQKTKILKIQPDYSGTKGSEFVDLFVKKSTIMNIKVLLKNYMKYAKRNLSQSKDKTNMFEINKNTSIEKKNRTVTPSTQGT